MKLILWTFIVTFSTLFILDVFYSKRWEAQIDLAIVLILCWVYYGVREERRVEISTDIPEVEIIAQEPSQTLRDIQSDAIEAEIIFNKVAQTSDDHKRIYAFAKKCSDYLLNLK